MCLILFAYRSQARYELVLAANRDEFYHRPSLALHRWTDGSDIVAGRDLLAGGTWLGVTGDGRMAAVTNYREPTGAAEPAASAPSRGVLVSDFLQSSLSARAFCERVAAVAGAYRGFNLLLKDADSLVYYSNRGGPPRALAAGVYGLSNHLLDTPWPKVERGRAQLRRLLIAEPTAEALLALLQDNQQPDDDSLPGDELDRARERALAPIFITTPNYGTRCSTALLMDRQGRIRIAEKTYPGGAVRRFSLDAV